MNAADDAVQDAVSISEADLAHVSAEIRRTKRPKRIKQRGVEDPIILGARDYEELQEAIEVAAGLLRGEADAAARRVYSHDEAMALIQERIEAARKVRLPEAGRLVCASGRSACGR
jgi:PHD/YefM family antitoxin component YafN of YafNO toxin-antitoxin module